MKILNSSTLIMVFCLYIKSLYSNEVANANFIFDEISNALEEGRYSSIPESNNFTQVNFNSKKISTTLVNTVFRIDYKETSYCLKISDNERCFNRESAILSNYQHLNIVKVYQNTWFHKINKGAILMEFLVTLVDYKSIQEDRFEIAKLLLDLMKAIFFLTKNNVLHCDIKLKNICGKRIDDKVIYKIIDFDLSRVTFPSISTLQSRSSAIAYMAPEVFYNEKLSYKSDIYNLGAVGYYLLNEELGINVPLYKLKLKYLNCKPYKKDLLHLVENECKLNDICPTCIKCKNCKFETKEINRRYKICRDCIHNEGEEHIIWIFHEIEESQSCQKCKNIDCKLFKVLTKQKVNTCILCESCKICKKCKVCMRFKKHEKCFRGIYEQLPIRKMDQYREYKDDELMNFISTCLQPVEMRPDIISLSTMETTKRLFKKYNLLHDYETWLNNENS